MVQRKYARFSHCCLVLEGVTQLCVLLPLLMLEYGRRETLGPLTLLCVLWCFLTGALQAWSRDRARRRETLTALFDGRAAAAFETAEIWFYLAQGAVFLFFAAALVLSGLPPMLAEKHARLPFSLPAKLAGAAPGQSFPLVTGRFGNHAALRWLLLPGLLLTAAESVRFLQQAFSGLLVRLRTWLCGRRERAAYRLHGALCRPVAIKRTSWIAAAAAVCAPACGIRDACAAAGFYCTYNWLALLTAFALFALACLMRAALQKNVKKYCRE